MLIVEQKENNHIGESEQGQHTNLGYWQKPVPNLLESQDE